LKAINKKKSKIEKILPTEGEVEYPPLKVRLRWKRVDDLPPGIRAAEERNKVEKTNLASIKKKIKKVLPRKVEVKVRYSPVDVAAEWQRLPGHIREAERHS